MNNFEKIKEYEVHKAEVPSYEQWEKFRNALADNQIENSNLLIKNTKLKEQVNHLSKTQARQFVDNQKLQIKAKHAKDVVNIDTARQIKKLKELLKTHKLLFELEKDNTKDALQQGKYAYLINEIDQVLGEE